MAAAQLIDVSQNLPRAKTMGLGTMRPGEEGVIAALVNMEPGIRARLLSLGFAPGTRVKVVRKAPLADPIEYELRGGRISLRRSEANLITISL